MSKLEKAKRLRIGIIVLIIVLLIAMVSIIFLLANDIIINPKYKAGYTSRPFMNYKCLEKGQLCSYEDIMNSVKITIQVNDKEKHDFYLISNDEEKATFIMASNLTDKTDWHIESINFRGPTKAYRELLEKTSGWDNLQAISSYIYDDYGYKYFRSKCDTLDAQLNDLLYDCSDEITPARGYKSIEIHEDGIMITMNNPKNSEMNNNVFYEGPVYVRLATYEELFNITPDLEYPDWLIDGLNEEEGYWTMSSSTTPSQNYNKGAYALVNRSGEPKLVELMTLNDANVKYNKIGLRPVITIKKV